MPKLLTSLSLIVVIVLFPPATLALVSNNALPGDATYPIKRSLEEGIMMVASLTPVTKTWFTINRSNRRFEEVTGLIAKGESATESLDELVVQTTKAAEEIKKIKDPIKKQEYINNLSSSIDSYNNKLSQVQQSNTGNIAQSTPDPTPIITQTETITVTTSTSQPQPTEGASKVTPRPTPAPIEKEIEDEIDKAKKELDDIKKDLDAAGEFKKEDGQEDRNKGWSSENKNFNSNSRDEGRESSDKVNDWDNSSRGGRD